MKKNLLLLFVCLFGALSGVKAYTVDDLRTAGWTKVSAISNDASNENYVGNFVYVLVDAGSSNYVLSGEVVSHPWGGGRYTPSYRTLDNPFTSKYDVWTLEVRNDGFAMCNVETKDYYNSTDPTNPDGNYDGCWNRMATDFYTYGSFTFNKSEDKYNINGVQATSGYVGPWSGTVSNAGATAANKSIAEAPGFYIYRMAKATYARNYLKQTPNLSSPVDVSYLIVNPTIYQGGTTLVEPWGWSNYGAHTTDTNEFTEGTGNTRLKAWSHTGNSLSPFADNSRTLTFDYYQSVSNLPGGKYNISSDVYATQHIDIYLYFSDSNKNINNQKNVRITTDDKDIVDGSSTTFGVKANQKHSDRDHTLDLYAENFSMSVNPYLSTMATALPANGAMTAGLWYHFNVASAGKYVIAAETLNDIIYAKGSTTTLSAAGSNWYTAVQDLEAGDYYVRSSSANTLTVTSCISSVATALLANGAMTAGKWYYFDVATAGHYDVVAASLGNIVYTTDGNLAEDASVASKFSVKNNELSATRYYVKSSSDQTLQWFLTDPQNYNSRMSDVAGNWTAVQGTKKEYTKDNQKGVETYNGNNNDFTAGNILYQTINDLPNGNYEVTLWAWENFAPWDKDSNPHPTGDNIAQVFANDAAYGITVIEAYDDRDWNDANKYTLNCHVTNGTLTYGVKNIATGGNWAVCRPISLTYTGPYNEVVDDPEDKIRTYEGTFTDVTDVVATMACPFVDITGASFTNDIFVNRSQNHNGLIYASPAQIETIKTSMSLAKVDNVISNDGNVCESLVIEDGYPFFVPSHSNIHATKATYSRDIAAASNFGTICLPYELTSDDNIQYYTVKSISDGVLTLVETSTVDAGVPAVYKKKGAYAEATNIVITSTDAAIEDNASTQGETVQLIGTFTGLTVGDKDSSAGTAANGNYYIGTDNRFYQGANYITVNPFRAYITGSGENAARLTIQIEDENGTTSIVALEEFENENNLKDGKYLIDGKIVIVKNGVMYSANGQKLN